MVDNAECVARHAKACLEEYHGTVLEFWRTDIGQVMKRARILPVEVEAQVSCRQRCIYVPREGAEDINRGARELEGCRGRRVNIVEG